MSLAEENLGLARHIARRYHGPDREDLEQEAALALVEAEGTFDAARGTFSTWGGIHARERLSGLLDRFLHRPDTEPLFLEGDDGAEIERPEAAITPDFDAPLLVAQLRAALAQLPEADRVVLVARFWRGLTFEQLGAELGLSRERARQLEGRALKRVRKALRGR